DLIEFFEELEKSRVKERKRKDKEEKEVSEYLNSKSKELGKEIPFELMVYTNPNINPSRVVMNYKIIQYEKAFREFIDCLPDLEKGECFYYALFGRSKYDSTGTVKSDKAQLARGVSNKEYLFDKIKKLETKVGTYK